MSLLWNTIGFNCVHSHTWTLSAWLIYFFLCVSDTHYCKNHKLKTPGQEKKRKVFNWEVVHYGKVIKKNLNQLILEVCRYSVCVCVCVFEETILCLMPSSCFSSFPGVSQVSPASPHTADWTTRAILCFHWLCCVSPSLAGSRSVLELR